MGAEQLLKERPLASQTLINDTRQLHYVEVTDKESKPLILFIHGSPGEWQGWVEYLNDPELQKHAHMIAVDRPGFGGSDKGKTERSVEEQCRQIAPLLAKASPGQKVLVVGHSYGGPVAVRLAMDHKQITDLLILAGSIDPSQEQIEWYQYVAEWPLIRWIMPREISVANQEIMALKASLTEMLPLWPRITQRVTVMQGEKDRLVPPENADFAQRMLTKAHPLKIIRIPEMNHFIPWTRYQQVKAEILKLIE